MSFALKALAGFVALYLVIVVAAYTLQRRLMYFPDPGRVLPSQVGLSGVGERLLTMPDRIRVVAWYARAKPGRPTLLYFHGNGGSLAARTQRFRAYMDMGWGVYMMSYRGYGGSGGTPSERDNVSDARIAYGALLMEGVKPADVILYGESLGSGIAARLATEREAGGLVLEAPYTSIVGIAKAIYPFLPIEWLLKDRYETDKVLPQVHKPLLILHGKEDDVIPFEMGEDLLAIANPPKQLEAFPGAGHGNLYAPGQDAQLKVQVWWQHLKGQDQASPKPAPNPE